MYIDYNKQIRCRYDVNAPKESFRWLPMQKICSELGLVVDGMTTRQAALHKTLATFGFKRKKKGGTWHYLVPPVRTQVKADGGEDPMARFKADFCTMGSAVYRVLANHYDEFLEAMEAIRKKKQQRSGGNHLGLLAVSQAAPLDETSGGGATRPSASTAANAAGTSGAPDKQL